MGGEQMNDTFEFDFMPMGLAIKTARNQKGLTREQFAEQLDITPRHLQSIEIEGQYPGFLLFVRIITLLDISADQYLLSKDKVHKTTLRRQIDSLLDRFNDKELSIIEGTAKAICKTKEPEE